MPIVASEDLLLTRAEATERLNVSVQTVRAPRRVRASGRGAGVGPDCPRPCRLNRPPYPWRAPAAALDQGLPYRPL